jgi:large subunit ribosomal protein L9
MQIILLERIAKLGQMGDIVKVRDGYARNFLLPTGKALRATKDNLARFEQERAQLEARNLELKKEAEAVAAKLGGESFIALRQASGSGQLYGSVSTRDIAETVTEGGFSLSRAQVLLKQPIKALGQHAIQIRLHPEVEIEITINVARTMEEAERQTRGATATDTREKEDETAEAVTEEATEETADENNTEDQAETA